MHTPGWQRTFNGHKPNDQEQKFVKEAKIDYRYNAGASTVIRHTKELAYPLCKRLGGEPTAIYTSSLLRVEGRAVVLPVEYADSTVVECTKKGRPLYIVVGSGWNGFQGRMVWSITFKNKDEPPITKGGGIIYVVAADRNWWYYSELSEILGRGFTLTPIPTELK